MEKKLSFSLTHRKQQFTWSAEYFLTAWMSWTLSGQWLRLHARPCSVIPQ